MRRLILFGLAAGALSGCAATERVGPDMTWGLFEDSHEGAKLVLGVPETDHVQLMMTCRPRSGRIDLTVIGRTDDPAAVELQSGKVVGRYAGVGVADDEIEGGRDIELKLTTDDPVISRLGDKGDLTIVFPTRRIVLPNAFSQAHDFLNICRPRI